MNALVQVDVEPSPSTHSEAVKATAVRMADEGIPVRAIARSVRLPSEEVYEILKEAIEHGTLVDLPKSDWPVGSSRGARTPAPEQIDLEDEDQFHMACTRAFRATRLEAALLSVLLRRNEVTKQQLHNTIEARRPAQNREPTDPKMVDVIICHLRKKLKDKAIVITTVWGIGYRVSQADRNRALNMLTYCEEAEA